MDTPPAPQPFTRADAPPRPWALIALAALGLALFAFAYGPAPSVPFVYDDLAEIVSNPAMHDLGDLRAIVSYNPARLLLLLSFALQWNLSGADPGPYHLVNLALHLLSALLVFRLALRLKAGRAPDAPAPPAPYEALGPAIAALLFLLHPLFVETVTYIASRSSGLCAALYLGAVLAYVAFLDRRAAGGRAWPLYALTLALSAGAVATKEIAATLPAALILAQMLLEPASPKGAPGRARRWAPLILPFAFLAGMLLLRIAFVGELGGGPKVRTVGENLLTEAGVVALYLLRFILPHPLSVYHDVPTVSTLTPGIAAAIALHAGLIALGVRGLLRGKIYAFPLLWFYLTLLPTSSVFPLKEAMAEHRAYLPGMGLLAGLGALLPTHVPRLRGALIAAALALMATSAALTHRYNQLWTDEAALWQHAVDLAPHSGDARYALGDALRRAGQVDASIAAYEASVAAYEAQGLNREGGRTGEIVVYNYPDALNNLGLAYAMKGDLDRAIPLFRRASRAYPNLSAKAYTNLGYALIQRGEFASAEVSLRQAIEAEPSSLLAHWHLANLYYGFLGQPQKSLEHYRAVIAISPDFPEREAVDRRIQELSY